jgi:hypothetical protein
MKLTPLDTVQLISLGLMMACWGYALIFLMALLAP